MMQRGLALLVLALVSLAVQGATIQGEVCANSRVHAAGYCPADLSSPGSTSVADTSASCTAVSDADDGTQHVCVTTISTPLTGAAVESCSGGAAVAGSNAAVSTSGTQTVGVTGLSASTSYYCQSVNESPEGWYSDVVVSSQFTTGSDILSNLTFPSTGETTAELSVDTTQAGTLYCVVTSSSTEPSEAQIASGQDHTGSSASWGGSVEASGPGTETLNASGLTGGQTYHAYCVLEYT